MNLAFCLFNYFPHGGLQRDFLRIANECLQRGHSVTVFTMQIDGEIDPALKVNIIPTTAKQNHTRAKQFVKQLKPHLKNYDLTVGFNKIPGLDVYYAADTCYKAKSRQKNNFLYRLTPRYRHYVNYENAVFDKNATTEILLISEKQRPEFIKHYNTQTERFHLLPPGISRDRVASDNAMEIRKKTRDEFHIKTSEFLLLMVGSGFKTKGLDRILKGIAALPENIKKYSKLFVIGNDNSNLFIKLAKKLNILSQVHFLGGRDDVPQFFLAADILLHPAYNENTGTVLLEAVASGLPVLTTDVCGYAHYIEEANAGIVLTSPFKQDEFNHTLENMLLSSEENWRENGINFAKKADIYSMPERAVDVIEKVLIS